MARKAAFEATPILVEGKLVLSTQYNQVIALDPEKGTKLWEYDPRVNLQQEYSEVASIADNWRVDTGRGIVRAFDARTGKLRWTWDPIRKLGTKQGDYVMAFGLP